MVIPNNKRTHDIFRIGQTKISVLILVDFGDRENTIVKKTQVKLHEYT